ncbi:LIM domain protein [Ostertagia ostertagi]
MDRAADRRLCGQCHTSIGDEAVVAMNRLWHPDHFTCTACKRPIKQTYQIEVNSMNALSEAHSGESGVEIVVCHGQARLELN